MGDINLQNIETFSIAGLLPVLVLSASTTLVVFLFANFPYPTDSAAVSARRDIKVGHNDQFWLSLADRVSSIETSDWNKVLPWFLFFQL